MQEPGAIPTVSNAVRISHGGGRHWTLDRIGGQLDWWPSGRPTPTRSRDLQKGGRTGEKHRIAMSNVMCAHRYLWSLLVLLAPISQALPETVRDWRNAMYYPARVLAVHWSNGRLDARSSVRFGAWTVRFGGSPRYAVHWTAGISFISIMNDQPSSKTQRGYNTLRCSNSALGEAFCGLEFNLANSSCNLLIYGHLARDTRYVAIPCPTALELAQ
jgi:hypothetical protein